MNGFSSALREELMREEHSAQCCRRALLYGLLINADCGLGGAIYARVTGRDQADRVCGLLLEQYGRECVPEYSNCYGRSTAELSFVSEKLAAVLSGLSDGEKTGEGLPFFRCRECRGAFCSGLMLAAASVADPEKALRAEIRVNDPSRAERIAGFFAGEGLCPSFSLRNGVPSLIFKKSDDLETLLAMSGAKKAAMTLMQRKMVTELRGEVNRRSNCEVRNLNRAAGAAAAQLDAVHVLREAGRFELLNDDLRETAALREAHPEASMAELAAMHEPPITKSGLNHRMEKIMAAAAEAAGTPAAEHADRSVRMPPTDGKKV